MKSHFKCQTSLVIKFPLFYRRYLTCHDRTSAGVIKNITKDLVTFGDPVSWALEFVHSSLTLSWTGASVSVITYACCFPAWHVVALEHCYKGGTIDFITKFVHYCLKKPLTQTTPWISLSLHISPSLGVRNIINKAIWLGGGWQEKRNISPPEICVSKWASCKTAGDKLQLTYITASSVLLTSFTLSLFPSLYLPCLRTKADFNVGYRCLVPDMTRCSSSSSHTTHIIQVFSHVVNELNSCWLFCVRWGLKGI